MRTPGHALLNLAILAPPDRPAAVAVFAGALAPDLPILWLYVSRKLRGASSAEIWETHYQQPFWLNAIHLAHSIPMALLGAGVSLLLGADAGAWFFASALLHALFDLPVHATDAHRHFLPLSGWRFVSPFSYWDVTRHARTVTAVEWGLVFAASALIVARAPGLPDPALAAVAAVHVGYAVVYARLLRAPGLAR